MNLEAVCFKVTVLVIFVEGSAGMALVQPALLVIGDAREALGRDACHVGGRNPGRRRAVLSNLLDTVLLDEP